MPDSGKRGERVNVFEVDDVYLFKHYFEGEAVFAELKPYYDNQGYRFEVSPAEFDDLRAFLAENGYELRVVEDLAPFVVAVEQYTDHPENIFKESVIHRSAEGYNCFLMTDQIAVARAVGEGAVRIGETSVENPF